VGRDSPGRLAPPRTHSDARIALPNDRLGRRDRATGRECGRAPLTSCGSGGSLPMGVASRHSLCVTSSRIARARGDIRGSFGPQRVSEARLLLSRRRRLRSFSHGSMPSTHSERVTHRFGAAWPRRTRRGDIRGLAGVRVERPRANGTTLAAGINRTRVSEMRPTTHGARPKLPEQGEPGRPRATLRTERNGHGEAPRPTG